MTRLGHGLLDKSQVAEKLDELGAQKVATQLRRGGTVYSLGLYLSNNPISGASVVSVGPSAEQVVAHVVTETGSLSFKQAKGGILLELVN